MDGTPIGSLQPGVIRTSLEGLMSQNVPVIDQITSAQRFVVGDASGTVGIMPSKAMLAPAPATTVIGVAEGADANINSWAADKHTFNVIRLAEAGVITEGAKRAALANNINGLSQCMELPVKKVCADMNQMLRATLVSTSLNLTQAAGTVWSSSSATPLKNITAALKKIGGRNAEIMAMFGYDEIDNLRFHPDFTNGFANLSSAGVPNDRIAQVIAQVCGINTVVIGDNIYNSANPGQAVALGYQFNGVAWIGYAKDFVFVEQGAFVSETGRDLLKASDICTYERRVYIGRGHQEMGCIITGVAS
jgi:hypothetical protein